jgi:hypothetical protein
MAEPGRAPQEAMIAQTLVTITGVLLTEADIDNDVV